MTVQCVRYRGKINIQRPRKPHYERARINFATAPLIEPTYERCRMKLTGKKKIIEKGPYSLIIAREVRQHFENSKVVAFFHMNPIKAEPQFDAQVAFHKQGMKLKAYNKNILQLALEGTKFEPILPLFQSSSSVVFSPEPKLPQILKISKKIPQMILLAGYAEERYLSKNELVALAQMADIQVTRAQFAAVLDSVGGQLVQNLQAHQTNLVSLLDLHAKGTQTSDAGTVEEPKTTEG